MQLVINTRGAYLKKEKNCFLVKNDDKSFEVSADKVDSILITTSATITTDAIEFAVENNIDIVFLNYFGDPYGHQLDFLKDLKKNRPDDYDTLTQYIAKIEQLKDNLMSIKGSLDEKRGSIMGTEGMASLTYFEALSSIMPDPWKFNGRSRDPARDAFNCLLNYGYGVLYSQVEKACIIAGLDPYMGFLHTDNYNKKSFVFDLIEMFRIHIDRTVMNLFSKKQVHEGLFDKIPGGLYLNKEGKAVLITAINEALDKEIEYNGRNVKVRNTIQMECHSIANSLIK